MMDGDIERYLAVGRSAIAAIHNVVPIDFCPKSILDIPCGHGRVARHLRMAFPGALLFVSDIDEIGMAFCASEFNATALSSADDFDKLELDQPFDLIWVGSLLTHLPKDAALKFLRFVSRHLSAEGRAVITTHGAFVIGRMTEASKFNNKIYGISIEKQVKLINDYFNFGFGYGSYDWSGRYGITACAKSWIESSAKNFGLLVDGYLEHAWDRHQDVISLRLNGVKH